jgi:hypothetical protein
VTAETFFDDIVGRGGVPRDDHGNALVLPAGATTDRLVPYTSASSLAGAITDDSHIHRWEMRNLAKAMGQSPDLALLAAAEPYSTGLSNPTVGRAKSASGRALDRIIERALDRVGLHEKADYGTAVHAFTEPDNHEWVPPQAADDVAAFNDCVKRNGILIIATEVFTANDTLRAAGTFDHLCWVPGYGVVICDKKTGKMNPHEFGVQLSVYAYGEVYDPRTRTRRSLEDLAGEAVNRRTGVVFAISDGRCVLKEVDLERGYEGAKAAAAARDYQAEDGMLADAEKYVSQHARRMRADLDKQIRATHDRDHMVGLRRTMRHLWTDDHDTLAKETLTS